MKPSLLILIMLWATIATTLAVDSPKFTEARACRRAFGDTLMSQVLADKKSHPLVYALAGLYTGRDLAGANHRIRQTWAEAAGPNKTMTAELAGDEQVKWCMRGWLRIYYLFHEKSTFYPARLEPDVQAKLEEMFFLYGCYKSTMKVLSRTRNATVKNYEFKEDETDGDWLWPKEDKPPVVFVVSRVSWHKTVDDFLAYLGSHDHGIINGRATYRFVDETGGETSLELDLKDLTVPLVNGDPVDLQPHRVFDGPFIDSTHGSGVVHIRKGDRHMHLDFNNAIVTNQR